MIKRSLVAALALVMVLACQNPFSSTPGSTNSATRSLTISWHVGNANGRTLFPPSYPTPSTYDVLLHPTIGTDISQTGLSGTTWTFNNLSSVVYTITVAGKDGGGYVIVSGSGTADLTIASVQNPTITLSYISSGTGTGQIHLTFDASGAGATVTATALTLVDPSGATIVNGASLAGSSPTFSYTNTSATVGSYQVFGEFAAGAKVALKLEGIAVFQSVDTAVTITLTSGDFNDIYVPVTGLSLSAHSMDLTLGGNTGSLTAALSPANASNTIVSWSSDMPAVATVDQNGVVTAVALGTATIRVSAVDNPVLADSCTVTVLSSSKALTSFGFVAPAVSGTITESTHNITVTVPYGTNVAGLVAVFTTTGAQVKVGNAVQVSGTTANSFTTPVTYTVVAADGSAQDYVVTVGYSAVLPTVTTASVSSFTAINATCGGDVASDGLETVTARGACWSTSQNPTTSNSTTSDGSSTGSFSSSLTGLSPGTLYYVRAYATNSVGTAYGAQVSFTTMKQVNGGTTITQPPIYTVTINGPTTLHYGTQATFSCSYTGTPTAYAWYLDASPIPIEAASSLSITPTVSTYTYGAHILTLTVTDANGMKYAGSLGIRVQN